MFYCFKNVRTWSNFDLIFKLSLFIFPSIFTFESCWRVDMLFFLNPFSPSTLYIVLALLIRLFGHIEIVIIDRFIFWHYLWLVLFELVIETILLTCPWKGVLLACIKRRQRWLVSFVMIFVLYQQILLIVANHPSIIVLLLSETTWQTCWWLTFGLLDHFLLRLQIRKRINKSFREIFFIVFKSGIFCTETFHSHVLDLELEHFARNAWQVYIEISLHQ